MNNSKKINNICKKNIKKSLTLKNIICKKLKINVINGKKNTKIKWNKMRRIKKFFDEKLEEVQNQRKEDIN